MYGGYFHTFGVYCERGGGDHFERFLSGQMSQWYQQREGPRCAEDVLAPPLSTEGPDQSALTGEDWWVSAACPVHDPSQRDQSDRILLCISCKALWHSRLCRYYKTIVNSPIFHACGSHSTESRVMAMCQSTLLTLCGFHGNCILCLEDRRTGSCPTSSRWGSFTVRKTWLQSKLLWTLLG